MAGKVAWSQNRHSDDIEHEEYVLRALLVTCFNKGQLFGKNCHILQPEVCYASTQTSLSS